MKPEHQKFIAGLARMGYIVSFCYGPIGSMGGRILWTVTLRAPDGREFEQPIAGMTLDHCVQIIIRELREREWLSGPIQSMPPAS